MRSDDLLAELERSIENARPVPLTDQVRIDRKAFLELLEELRQALAAERR